MVNRVDTLLAAMKQAGLSSMLVVKPRNMRYLTGYTGEGRVLINETGVVILTDFRYIEQAEIQTPYAKVIRCDSMHPWLAEVRQLMIACEGRKLAIEEDAITVDSYREMLTALSGIELTSAQGLIERMRVVKDEDEIECLAKACEISCKAFDKLLGFMKAGMTEKEIQLELDYTMLRLGADGIAFPTIAAAGTNGSLPHAIPSDKVVREGEMLTLDFGALYSGYRADMTRTVAFGNISDELKAIYDTVLEAQLEALKMIRPGVVCSTVDKRAREIIDARYPGAFGHSLGHGVGLDVHEQPGFNSRDQRQLTPGHVITVEPGVYIPGVGGCRIEDSVVVTEEGYRNLIDAPKELIQL